MIQNILPHLLIRQQVSNNTETQKNSDIHHCNNLLTVEYEQTKMHRAITLGAFLEFIIHSSIIHQSFINHLFCNALTYSIASGLAGILSEEPA